MFRSEMKDLTQDEIQTVVMYLDNEGQFKYEEDYELLYGQLWVLSGLTFSNRGAAKRALEVAIDKSFQFSYVVSRNDG